MTDMGVTGVGNGSIEYRYLVWYFRYFSQYSIIYSTLLKNPLSSGVSNGVTTDNFVTSFQYL